MIVRMRQTCDLGEQVFNYINNGTTVPGVPRSFVRWNAAINFTMLKDEKGVLRISVYSTSLTKGARSMRAPTAT
jgi:hypothetical protein